MRTVVHMQFAASELHNIICYAVLMQQTASELQFGCISSSVLLQHGAGNASELHSDAALHDMTA
jgi:hypothetical protein